MILLYIIRIIVYHNCIFILSTIRHYISNYYTKVQVIYYSYSHNDLSIDKCVYVHRLYI